METLSFVLGIAFIVVIALAIVATYAFVKVIKVQKEINDLDRRFADIYQCIAEENTQTNRRVDDFEKEIFKFTFCCAILFVFIKSLVIVL